VNFVAVLQFRAPRIAMHLLAHAVAHDPGAALALARFAARIPAVGEQPVFAGHAVELNVRVLARDRAVDLGLGGKRQVVAAEQPRFR